jgi:hypothetical protein
MHSRPPLLIALALLSACFSSPPTGSIPVRCGEGDPCPDGWVCRESLCVLPGAAPQDMSAPGDLSISAVGCASGGGFKLSDRVYACPGAFGVGEARGLCSAGWQFCKDGLTVPLAECRMLNGFFLADVPAHLNPAFVCASTTIFDPALMGCGTANFYADTPGPTCAGFRQYAKTIGPIGHYIPQSLQNTQNIDGRHGVLCCKP